jgi:acyl-CoA thioester hydrolase
MPIVYERAFRVRYDECDAYGHVNHANYLRYMQESAFDASAAVGYDFDKYEQMNRLWLVHDTEITFLRPLLYGDTVVVKTWVEDFRRVLSRRKYQLILQATKELVAEATTDWIFLNSANMRPAKIPAQLMSAFGPEDKWSKTARRRPFPEPPAPPPGVFRTRRRVKWSEIDGAHHVNNSVYLTYLEDCAFEFVRREGWPVERMATAGFGIVARNFHIEYKCPAGLDEELEIATWVADVKRVTAVRHYTIIRPQDGQLLTRARALWVWVDLETGRPTRIPADFLSDLSANVVRESAG